MKRLKPLLIKLQFACRQRYQSLLRGSPQTAGLRLGLINLKSGEAVGEHITEAKEELIVILSGKARISLGKRDSAIADKRSVIYIPADTIHNVQNIGKNRLKYIYIVSPLKSIS